MQYMLLIYEDEAAVAAEDAPACYAASQQIVDDLKAKGQFVSASPLRSVALATSVRVRDGRKLVTDGPFAETREQLGGYFLIDVADLDEAMAVAARIPGAKRGTIEIRPVVDLAAARSTT